ncbi:MAG: hypothetical protein NTW40_09160 [Acidobacteria bacterium]|nr:hypothetical protein [Acidobacteriota bacterium]
MQQQIKRLGELLVEGGLITPAQLQSAITHQKIARGRLGSNLVALGYISEEVLVDFLSKQTGVPKVDVRGLEVPALVLRLIPHRLADQFSVLPVSLAMSDPSDLNAIDSSRFASGLNVEPVVASHSSLRKAIAEHYRRMEAPTGILTVEVAGGGQETALPVTFAMNPPTFPAASNRNAAFPRDPFFGASAPTQPLDVDPFGLFEKGTASGPQPLPDLVHSRTHGPEARALESYQTRTLVLGLIKLFQRRGIIGQGELQRFLANLLETGELKDTDKLS